MPALPEFSNTGCGIGEIEILQEVESEHANKPNGHIAVPTEITVDLKGEEDRGQHHGAARVRGRIGVQLVHDLVDGSSLHVTSAHWFTPKRNAIEGVGLTPDVVIEPGSDPLPRAIELVSGIANSNQ